MTAAVAPSDELAATVARLVASRTVGWLRVAGGYTLAERWVVARADGPSVFVKAATTDDTAAWLRAEARVYANVTGPFLPRCVAFEDGARPILVLEDLSRAHWPPPWRAGDVDRLRAALDAVHATRPPAGLPALGDLWDLRTGWQEVANVPEPFLSLGFADATWLARHLPALLAAEAAAPLAGDAFLHQDVRSDNVCFLDDRAVLVDWSWACLGNPVADLAAFLPSLAAQGGPLPDDVLPDAGSIAVALAGWWASRAGLPPPPGSDVRTIQRVQLAVALPWACRALGIDTPAGARR